jgi:hypothetical protein
MWIASRHFPKLPAAPKRILSAHTLNAGLVLENEDMFGGYGP